MSQSQRTKDKVEFGIHCERSLGLGDWRVNVIPRACGSAELGAAVYRIGSRKGAKTPRGEVKNTGALSVFFAPLRDTLPVFLRNGRHGGIQADLDRGTRQLAARHASN